MGIKFQAIGTIHTPYLAINAPDQPLNDATGDFWLTLKPEYTGALQDLDSFNYIYVLYYLDKTSPNAELLTKTPWAPEKEIGFFAGRTAQRPNPIGLSVVRIKEISGNEVTISGIDAYNGTPLLDIKPYFPFLDRKENAHNGWLDAIPDKDHIIAHIVGQAHNHDADDHHHPEHNHSHDRGPHQPSPSHSHKEDQHIHDHNHK